MYIKIIFIPNISVFWLPDGFRKARKFGVGGRPVRTQVSGGAVRRENRRRMDDDDQAKAVLGGGCGAGRLRQADRAGRRHRVHRDFGGDPARGRPVGDPAGPGVLHVAACLENVPAVLRHCAGRLSWRLRPGPW